MRKLSKMKTLPEPELQTTQDTEPTKTEYNTVQPLDMFSDEPKVKLMDQMPKTANFDNQTTGHKTSLRETVLGENAK